MKSALTAACLMLITIGGAQAANQEVLEPFDYDGAAAAQAAWVPAENSLPVGLAEHDGGQALRLNADFTDASSKRAVYDKEISLDLSRWSRFSVQVYTEDPGLIGHFMIYLHSGDGWYGISTALARKGWTTWS